MFLEWNIILLISLIAAIRSNLLGHDQTEWRRKLGLRVSEPMIRVRALDPVFWLAGQHDDFGLPLSAFARHAQLAACVVICENLLNFLTFPALPNAIAIWSGADLASNA